MAFDVDALVGKVLAEAVSRELRSQAASTIKRASKKTVEAEVERWIKEHDKDIRARVALIVDEELPRVLESFLQGQRKLLAKSHIQMRTRRDAHAPDSWVI